MGIEHATVGRRVGPREDDDLAPEPVGPADELVGVGEVAPSRSGRPWPSGRGEGHAHGRRGAPAGGGFAGCDQIQKAAERLL
ncbi:MAG: hypothetical protein AVDCRST_MAG55-2562 [uncultured Rubrobacteraceae bacterium]|uniref:Uncharacterized protein n=1 Tax=uncultured Rubrobacteraceae bacterium TaxID=349277 RepID=A0A6J4Q6Y8_9ACTN|nr:MAG: hypothetical protein AVDCRST_MAG55-2562 [uncultured Rubrobacteraceae bacterium]